MAKHKLNTARLTDAYNIVSDELRLYKASLRKGKELHVLRCLEAIVNSISSVIMTAEKKGKARGN